MPVTVPQQERRDQQAVDLLYFPYYKAGEEMITNLGQGFIE